MTYKQTCINLLLLLSLLFHSIIILLFAQNVFALLSFTYMVVFISEKKKKEKAWLPFSSRSGVKSCLVSELWGKRVKYWLRLSSCPLLHVCCVHLSPQMCLCVASDSRCTQCWNALGKYIQSLDRALALSQHSEVVMATAVQSSRRPLLPRHHFSKMLLVYHT